MEPPTILILCTGNSCRSHLAEGILRTALGPAATVASAGSNPTCTVHPMAIEVMAEIGVDISAQSSQHIDEFADVELDVVVTVCNRAADSCPIFRGTTRVIHHAFDDPPKLAAGAETEEEALEPYRRVRDEIRAFVSSLPEGLMLPSRTQRTGRR